MLTFGSGARLLSVNGSQPESFGDWMIRLRSEKGLTQVQLSELIQFDKAHISRIESGQREPTSDFIVALASALEIDVREALIRAGKPVYSQGDEDANEEATWREISRIIARLPPDRREDAIRWLNAYSLVVERENREAKANNVARKARGTT